MDDFTNDGEFDPDLEARLYGEIYYSNDSYTEPPLRLWKNSTLDGRADQLYIPQNNYSNHNHARNDHRNSTRYMWMTNPPIPKRFHNYRSSSSTSTRENLPSYQYPTLFSRNHNYRSKFPNPDSNNYRNYYPPNLNNDDPQSSYRRTQNYHPVVASYKSRNNYSRNPSEKPSTSRRRRSEYLRSSKTRELPRVSPQKDNNSNQESSVSTVEIINKNVDNNENLNVVDDNNSTSVVIVENIISNNDNPNKNVDNAANLIDYSDTASKYDVKEKQKQTDLSNVINMDNDVINCSDSEESIFEVPVPPKPKPPLINLQDSDDSSGAEEIEINKEEEGGKEEEEEENLIIIDDVEKSNSNLSPEKSGLDRQNNYQNVNPPNIENVHNESTDINVDQNNIVLNCVALQKCASSLGDIRQIREAASVSDDSMTDSEALNWGTIEGQIIQDRPSIPDDDSNHGHFNINDFEKPHHNGIARNTSECTRSDKSPMRKPPVASNSKKSINKPLHILESPSCSKDNQNVNIIINCNTGESTVEVGTLSSTVRLEKNKKKPYKPTENKNYVNINRNREEASTSTKKSRTSIKSASEMSFEEYIFQPMSDKLKEYYDTFRGEEFMNDVTSIQNQMPKNPNRWAILDVDLFGPKRWDKHLRCTICHNFGHKKDRCPAYKQVMVCYMCGEHGHTEPRCPYKMCLTCGTKYSTYRKTCENCRNLICTTCKAQGHLNTNCPDLWRRFHQTTESYTVNAPSNPEVSLKTPNKLACCNCTKRGHESTTCQRYRWSQHFPTPRFITNYNQPPFYTPNLEIPASTESSEILYHSTNYSSNIVPIEWITEEIYPHTLSGITYSFTQNNLPTPGFLKKHIPTDVYYDITISRLSNDSNCIFSVKSVNNELVCGIKKLIVQWLQRTPEDRSLMDTTKKLPIMQIDLINDLSTKWRIFNEIRFRKIYHWHNAITNSKNKLVEMEEIKKLSGKTSKLLMRQKILKKRLPLFKKGLLAYTYRSSLLSGAANVLKQFQELIDKLKKYPVLAPVPNDLYLSAVWYNFELFTPHASEYILLACQKGLSEQDKFEVEKNRPRRKKNKRCSENRDIQIIDLTETDRVTSMNVIELHDKGNKTPERKNLELKNSSEKRQNKTTNVKRKLRTLRNTTGSNEDHFHRQEQIQCADEILKFVKENRLKNFIRGAHRLMKEARMSLLKKEHIIHFWTLIRSSDCEDI